MVRCSKIIKDKQTKRSRKCKNQAVEGSNFCAIHKAKKTTNSNVKVLPDPVLKNMFNLAFDTDDKQMFNMLLNGYCYSQKTYAQCNKVLRNILLSEVNSFKRIHYLYADSVVRKDMRPTTEERAKEWFKTSDSFNNKNLVKMIKYNRRN